MKHLKFSLWATLVLFVSGSILTLIGLFFSASTRHVNPFLIAGPLVLIFNLATLIYATSKSQLKMIEKAGKPDKDPTKLLLQLRPLQLGLIITVLAELVVGLLLTSIAPTMTYSYISSFLCCLICVQLIVYIATLVVYRNKT